MTGTPIALLAECESLGIRLTLTGDGGLAIDAPQEALTPDLIDRLKAHKAELLAMLRPAPETAPAVAVTDPLTKPAKEVCRCGGTTWHDVPIHGGKSLRRDCDRCGRFLAFPVWYGKNALHFEQ